MRVFPARVVKFGLTSLLACIFGCRLRKQFAQPHFNKLIRLWKYTYSILNMARLSVESWKRVVTLHGKDYSVSEIRMRLLQENISVSTQAIHNLLRKFRDKLRYCERSTMIITFLKIHA